MDDISVDVSSLEEREETIDVDHVIIKISKIDRENFACQTCGKQFRRKDTAKVHFKRKHLPQSNARSATRLSRIN